MDFDVVDIIVGGVDAKDESAHTPDPVDGERWQESWCFSWADPCANASGLHHFGLRPQSGRADIWSWIAKDGRVVGRHHSLTLKPTQTSIGIDLGGATITPLSHSNVIRSRQPTRALVWIWNTRPSASRSSIQ